MDAGELGKKIRELRLAKKMTQSELVGDFITRNMLSQIESGVATPSMRTLDYLAGALGVPVSTLVPGQDGSSLDTLVMAKQALSALRYQETIEHSIGLPPALEDEAQALQARAHLAIAKELANQRQYKSAIDHARLAAEMAGKGAYASREIRMNALLLLDEISQ